MMEMTLLDRAAEVRERNAALKRTCQELRQIDAEWTTYAIAAEEAMRIADDGLRNAWNMLDRLNQLAKEEIGRMATANGEVRGASRLAGEASSAEGATSTVVLGAVRPGKY